MGKSNYVIILCAYVLATRSSAQVPEGQLLVWVTITHVASACLFDTRRQKDTHRPLKRSFRQLQTETDLCFL